jgi:hypothetical protein
MGKAWHHRAEGNYLYLCVWVKLCILFIFFKRSFCNRAHSELKCETGMKEYILLEFYHIKTVVS